MAAPRRTLPLPLPLALAAGLMVALAGGCKKPDHLEPVELGATEFESNFEGAEAFAPTWSPPTVVESGSGLLFHWFTEADSPLLNIRVVLALPEKADTTALVLATATIDAELQRRFAGSGTTVRMHHGPDRLEVEVHAMAQDTQLVFEGLADVFEAQRPQDVLDAARRPTAVALADRRARRLAVAHVTARLLHRKPAPIADPSRIASADDGEVARTYAELLDPRRAVMVVHTGTSMDDAAARVGVDALTERWKSTRPLTGLLKSGRDQATARLRASVPDPAEGKTFIAAKPQAPLEIASSTSGEDTGTPYVVLGRLIPTATATERAYARLSQRVLQEDLDCRVVIAGPVSLFTVRVPLRPSDPARNLIEALDDLEAFASTQHRRDRLEQAAQMHLGTRLVRASIRGEDWTALWSDALDLSDSDAEIPIALAREAQLMLQTDPEALLAWQQAWLRPDGGRGGWQWALSGGDEAMAQTLAQSVLPEP